MKPATLEGYQSPDTEFRKDGYHIVPTPAWVTVVRGFQALLALVTMIMAGLLIHGYVAGENVWAIVCVCCASMIASMLMATVANST